MLNSVRELIKNTIVKDIISDAEATYKIMVVILKNIKPNHAAEELLMRMFKGTSLEVNEVFLKYGEVQKITKINLVENIVTYMRDSSSFAISKKKEDISELGRELILEYASTQYDNCKPVCQMAINSLLRVNNLNEVVISNNLSDSSNDYLEINIRVIDSASVDSVETLIYKQNK